MLTYTESVFPWPEEDVPDASKVPGELLKVPLADVVGKVAEEHAVAAAVTVAVVGRHLKT